MNYPDLTALSPELKKIIADKRDANVYKMLMHSPNVAPGFTAMADAVMWSKAWPATWRELAIVRVGQSYGSAYEVHQHERIGRLVGLTDAQLGSCARIASAAIAGRARRRAVIPLLPRHGRRRGSARSTPG